MFDFPHLYWGWLTSAYVTAQRCPPALIIFPYFCWSCIQPSTSYFGCLKAWPIHEGRRPTVQAQDKQMARKEQMEEVREAPMGWWRAALLTEVRETWGEWLLIQMIRKHQKPRRTWHRGMCFFKFRALRLGLRRNAHVSPISPRSCCCSQDNLQQLLRIIRHDGYVVSVIPVVSCLILSTPCSGCASAIYEDLSAKLQRSCKVGCWPELADGQPAWR